MESNHKGSDESTPPQFGDYRPIECLGKSHCAHTYLVEDVHLKRLLVVKQLNPDRVRENARYLQYFQQEAQMLAKLEHPHIVEIWHYQADGTEAWIVMPYAEEGTLRKLLQDHGGSMTPQEVLPILEQIVEGLAYAHNQSDLTNEERRGILHLDLKPENILIEEIKPRTSWFRVEARGEKQRHYRLADFGIARWMNKQTGRPDGYSWFGAGTQGYRAPEQSLGGSGETTVRSDVFSLGIMVHEMLSGKRPPTGPGEKLRPLQGIKISPDIEAVIQQATHPDPSERFENVTGFLNAFKRAMTGSEIVGNPAAPLPPTRPLPPRPPKQKRPRIARMTPSVLIGSALLISLLLGIFIGVILLNHPALMTRLGGTGFSAYCKSLGYDEVTADDTSCFAPITLDTACRFFYSFQSNNVIAQNSSSPNSQNWGCYTGPLPQGKYVGDLSNLTAYCQKLYQYGAQAILLNNKWSCEQNVNPTIVCIWQFGVMNVQASNQSGQWACYNPS